MKAKLTLTTLLIALCMPAYAQRSNNEPKLSLSGIVGYALKSRAHLGQSYTAVIRDAPQYGGLIEYKLRDQTSLGISYTYMDAHVLILDPRRIQLNVGREQTAFNYIMLHGIRYFGPNHADVFVRPYAGIGAGIALINIQGNSPFSRLAMDVRLGAKLNASAPVSLLVQVQFQSIIQGIMGGLYFGTGGSGTAIAVQSSLVKVVFSGGLSFNF